MIIGQIIIDMLKIASTEINDYKPFFPSNILKKTISDDSKLVEKFDDIKKWNYLFSKNNDNLNICNGYYEYLQEVILLMKKMDVMHFKKFIT